MTEAACLMGVTEALTERPIIDCSNFNDPVKDLNKVLVS